MTRNYKAGIVLSAAVLACSFAYSDGPMKNWEFSKVINVLEKDKKIAAAPIDAEVYNSAKPDLGDLRVADNLGEEHPFALFSQNEAKTLKGLGASILAREITDTESVMTVEIKNPGTPYNAVELIPDDKNFARFVIVEGSDDNMNWKIVRKGTPVYYFNFTSHFEYFENYTNETYTEWGFENYTEKNLWIEFPECRFRYLRIKVPHGQSKAPVSLKDAKVYKLIKADAQKYIFNSLIVDKKAGAGNTEITADLGAKNIPVSAVEFSARQENFFRKIKVQASNDMKEWKDAGSGVIFSIKVDNEPESKLNLDINGIKCRYLKITVYNGDNKPLLFDGIKATALKKFVVFIPEEHKAYSLVYGNPAARPVSYDLAEIIKGKTAGDFAGAGLGKEVRNAGFIRLKEEKPWTEDKPYLLWAVMGGIMIGIIVLAGKVIKKMD